MLIEELERGDETEREDNNGEPETLSIVEEESEGEEMNSNQMQDGNKENYSTEITEDNCSNSDIENMLKQFPHKVNVGTVVELVTVPMNNDVSTYFSYFNFFSLSFINIFKL